MTAALTIAIIALVLSLISTCIGVVSFCRTRKLQNYDYAPRLQIEEEDIRGSDQKDAFRYGATLVNRGAKSIQVDRIFVDYGGETDGDYFKHEVQGRFHLPPSGKQTIQFVLSLNEHEELLKKLNIEECLFRLRVCFLNATGDSVETTRKLLRLASGKATMYVQRGEAVT